MATLEAARDKEHRYNRFMAALNGVDLDADSKRESKERVIAEMERIEAELNGGEVPVRNAQSELAEFGIAIVEGD